MFRIAAVSFLNTIPLVDGLESLEGERVALTRDLPSRLRSHLEDGSADVALLPVVEILRGGTGGILPAGGIACQGAVDSVKVFSRTDPEYLTRIAADRGSRASVALLRVLLAELYGTAPAIHETTPRTGQFPAEGEGILIIGDRCFEYERFLREEGHSEIRSWDLGRLWWELTGQPFVFAVWAVARDFVERTGDAVVAELKRILTEARRQGQANLSSLAAREAAAGRLGHEGYATAEAIDYYFQRSLRFTVGDEELAGIRQFHRLAIKHEVIPEGPMPPVL